MHEVKPSKDAALNQQHSYSLDPQQKPGCKVTWSVNGRSPAPGDEIGGLKIQGMNGILSVKVTDEIKDTIVSAIVNCHGQVEEAIPFVHWTSVIPVRTKSKWGEFLVRILRAISLTLQKSR